LRFFLFFSFFLLTRVVNTGRAGFSWEWQHGLLVPPIVACRAMPLEAGGISSVISGRCWICPNNLFKTMRKKQSSPWHPCVPHVSQREQDEHRIHPYPIIISGVILSSSFIVSTLLSFLHLFFTNKIFYSKR
jgi:hypothetical protein